MNGGVAWFKCIRGAEPPKNFTPIKPSFLMLVDLMWKKEKQMINIPVGHFRGEGVLLFILFYTH